MLCGGWTRVRQTGRALRAGGTGRAAVLLWGEGICVSRQLVGLRGGGQSRRGAGPPVRVSVREGGLHLWRWICKLCSWQSWGHQRSRGPRWGFCLGMCWKSGPPSLLSLPGVSAPGHGAALVFPSPVTPPSGVTPHSCRRLTKHVMGEWVLALCPRFSLAKRVLEENPKPCSRLYGGDIGFYFCFISK